MKKILIFSDEFPPEIGGAGVVAYQNALELRRRGYSVTVLTKKSVLKRKEPFEIIEIDRTSILWPLKYLLTKNFFKYDAYLLNDQTSIFTMGLLASRSILLKTICFIHGSEVKKIFLQPSFKRRLIFFRFFYEGVLTKCRKVIFPSHNMKMRFLDKDSIRLDNSIVSYAGVDPIFFNKPKTNYRHKLNIKDDAVVLLSVSRIIPEKGYLDKYLLFKRFLETQRDLYWIIVGDGPFLKNFKQMVLSDGLDGKILFIGGVPRESIIDIYHSANVFWLLSQFEESFGLVYLEANACGLPVIGSARGAVSEAIHNGVSGFVVTSLEECENIILEKKYLQISSENCVEYAKNFVVSTQFRNVHAVIKDIVGE